MTITPVAIAIVLIDVGLLIFAVRRPWIALVVLLAGLPFNGILLDVIGPALGITGSTSAGRFALAGWHDAIALGLVAAAALDLVRARYLPVKAVEVLGVIVLLFGLFALLRAPDLVAGMYAYRTLYLPIAVALAILGLAATEGLPSGVPVQAAAVIVAAAVIASVFALWQVYIGGYAYLNLWYHADGGLPAVYSAHFVNQPRAIGTFHSPNEFGAFLVIAAFLALTPGILALGRVRPWIGVLLGIALLLTFSRSSWVGAGLGLVVILVLRNWRPSLRPLGALVRAQAAPIVVFVAASSLILGTSNGARFVEATLLGDEPSAASHIGAIGDVFNGESASPRPTPRPSPGSSSPPVVTGERIIVTPLGEGLGTAGPKSARFTGTAPIRHSEIWYLNYAAQVGLLGLALTAAFVIAILATLWTARRRPWPAVATALVMALGAGAIFIPVIDEPAVAGPLWAILGLAIVRARSGRSQTIPPPP